MKMFSAKKSVIAAVVFFGALVGIYLGLSFAFPQAKEPKPTFLRVEGFWDNSVFNVLKKEFQKRHPEVTVEYEKKSPDHYLPNLTADLANPTKTPDVFWWHSGWGPVLNNSLAALPSKVMDTTTYEKTFYPITKTDLKIAGSYRGFPLEFDGLALLYNKRTFASRNFLEAPKTWTTLAQDYVPSLTLNDRNSRVLTSAIALGSVSNVENFSEIIGLFLLQNGVEFTKNGQIAFYDSKQREVTKLTSDAIDFYLAFSKKYHTWDNTQPDSIEAFARGQTAMIILPLYKIHDLLSFLRSSNLTLDFAVAPIPQLPNSPLVTWGSYWSVGVSATSRQKEAAWEFAKFMVAPDSLRLVYQNETKNSDFGRAYPRVAMAKEQTTNPYLAAYLAGAQYAKSWYLQSDTFDQVFNDKIIASFKTNLASVENSGSSESVLKRLATEIQPVLKKYGVVTTLIGN